MQNKTCLDLLYDNGLVQLLFVEEFARIHPPESFSILAKVLQEGLYVPERTGVHILSLLKDFLENRVEANGRNMVKDSACTSQPKLR